MDEEVKGPAGRHPLLQLWHVGSHHCLVKGWMSHEEDQEVLLALLDL